MKKLAIIVCSTLVMSASALAGGSYKSAGCGLGSLIIKDDGIVQIFAATTNGTFETQTFGITSGTSNCDGSGGYVKADAQQELYVSSNFDVLTREMARGNGEHLDALAFLMGCDKTVTPAFNADLKKNYRSIVGESTTPEQLLNTVKTTVSADSSLSKSCSG